jgi:hypothetical protein|tara:strand:+ start:76 stop:318 length:243 start_codon:yes stop_codon:yes gene_type:complete
MDREISGYYYDGEKSYIIYMDEHGNQTMEERFEPETKGYTTIYEDGAVGLKKKGKYKIYKDGKLVFEDKIVKDLMEDNDE